MQSSRVASRDSTNGVVGDGCNNQSGGQESTVGAAHGARTARRPRCVPRIVQRRGSSDYKVCSAPYYSPSEVEDVCQEILLAIYQSRHTFQPTRPLEPWLFAIAHNVCADHNQRHWARVSRQKLVDDVPENVAEGEASAALDLRRALGRLSQPQLEALKLTKIEGLSLAEVSERTGDSVGSLKVRVHRAYEFLKKAVSQ